MAPRDLPKIPVPNGALAIVHQLSEVESTPAPMHMFFDPVAAGILRKVPHKKSSSPNTALLYRAYLSARTVVAAEVPEDAQAMYFAERAEILAAASNTAPVDGSLAPRRVSVTLLAHGDSAGLRESRLALDALAHFAGLAIASVTGDDTTLTVSLIRMAVLAGPQAYLHATECQKDAILSQSACNRSDLELVMRWAESSENSPEPMLRAEFFQLASFNSLDSALQAIQGAMLNARTYSNVPLPLAVATHHPNVQKFAWAQAHATATNAFFRLLEGEGAVVKHPAVEQYGRSVDATGVYVRFCSRALGESGLIDNSSFHGMLLADSEKLADVVHFCDDYPNGLPPPDENTIGLLLHTCAVQAECFQLGQRVTLFDHHGKVGEPIRSPGSWIWRLSSAIRPVDASLLEHFVLVPCSPMSMLPGNKLLERPFREFFRRASDLFGATFGDCTSTLSGDAFERQCVTLPARDDGADPTIEQAERFALAAFGIDSTSRRIMVGDAYTLLSYRGAPAPICEFMLKASLRWGIGTPLLEVFSKAGSSITTHKSDERMHLAECENVRLRRVADAALALGGMKNAAPTQGDKNTEPCLEIDSCRLKPLLLATGIQQTSRKADIPPKNAKEDAYTEMVSLLASVVVRGGVDAIQYNHACKIALESRRRGIMPCIGNAICVLRASACSVTNTVFVIAQTDGLEGVSFNRVLPSGSMERVTAGTIVDTPLLSVILLRINGTAARLRACTRAR